MKFFVYIILWRSGEENADLYREILFIVLLFLLDYGKIIKIQHKGLRAARRAFESGEVPCKPKFVICGLRDRSGERFAWEN